MHTNAKTHAVLRCLPNEPSTMVYQGFLNKEQTESHCPILWDSPLELKSNIYKDLT